MRCKLTALLGLVLLAQTATAVSTERHEVCEELISASVIVDQGHPWRPPFGLDRVGSPPVARIRLDAESEPSHVYHLVAYQNGREQERHKLEFQRNASFYPAAVSSPSSYFALARLQSPPSEVSLQVSCAGGQELVRKTVSWAAFEVDAVARSDRLINPVDVGAILPPHDWLLLVDGQTAIVNAAAYSHARDFPNSKLRAWFDRGDVVELAFPMTRNRLNTAELKLPITGSSQHSTLHISLTDGEQELWRKDVQTMVMATPPNRPGFGAVATKLRYDPPIAAADPRTGEALPPIDYDTAWDSDLDDIVVFLPNGSRFVFWRGANYIPFWASRNNTGVLYQWAENCSMNVRVSHPDGTLDCPEPLFDSEMRFSKVRIVESSASRVHVRWDYQLTDVRYEVWGGAAREDFYFYPDGFGTRALTLPSMPGSSYQLSEFILLTPQGAYPLEVLPQNLIEALSLDGKKEQIEFPFAAAMDKANMGKGFNPPNLLQPDRRPMMYRLYSHKDETAAAIYFHPTDPAVPWAFPPFFDQGELVTPVYWGNHWPLNRGKWTGWGINDQVASSPAHNSVGGWSPPRSPESGRFEDVWEVMPEMSGATVMPDARGQVQLMNRSHFVWLIAYADVPDDLLRQWGESFSIPPAIEATGARLNIPSYISARRALSLIAEQSTITIKLKPKVHTINPVFEISMAPAELLEVELDGEKLPPGGYAWDGTVLWLNASIDPAGSTIVVRFKE